MATRVNTKFVIILSSALVAVVGLVAVLIFTSGMGFLNDASDLAKMGEASIQEAEAIRDSGDVDLYNAKLDRATRSFKNAYRKNPKNTEYLYRLIDAQEMAICDDMTLAYNHLDAIRGAAVSIHDTPGASDKDRLFMYELLHQQDRKDLVVNKTSAIAFINFYARNWLANHPGDELAMRYLAIGESGAIESDRTDSEEARKILENLTAAIEAAPQNPWLRNAAGRYHLGNARRLYRANGSSFNDEVNATFYRAYEELKRGVAVADETDNPAAMVEALGLMLQISSRDDSVATEIIGERIETARLLHETLRDKAERDKLFPQELAKAVRFIGLMGTGIEGHEFDGFAYSQELAETAVEDRPNDPSVYATLGALYSERSKLDEAEQTIEAGIKVLDNPDRKPNPEQYVEDVQARLNMLSTLAEVKINLAQKVQGEEPDRSKTLLVEAAELVSKLSKAPAPQIEQRDARTQFLRGRIDFAFNRPKQAVVRFEKANSFYNNADHMTLKFLAETHRKLGNDGKVIECYERIVELRPMDPVRLVLVHSYLNREDEKFLDKAETHLNTYLAQFPNNLMAIRLKAGLLGKREQYEQALALLQAQDLEKYPELRNDIAKIQAMMGNIDNAVQIVRDQIANRPEGQKVNLAQANQLLSMMPTLEAKLRELDWLEQQGLAADIAAIMRKFAKNGRLTLEDELALLAAQSHTRAAMEVRRFLIYQRWGKTDEAKKALDKAVQADPTHPEVIEWRFRMALAEKRWDDAELAIKDMMRLDLGDRPDIAIADGAFMRAQVIATRAIAMDPGSGRDKKLREAAVAYNEALKKYSHYVDGWVQLGRVQLVQDNFFGAQESLREALSRQSRNLQALEYMAQAEIATEDMPRALERYAQILRIQPNHPTALNQFTALAQQLGVPSRAIAQRESIRDRVPSNTDNRRQLALLYAQDLSYDQAKEEIDAVIALEGRTQPNLGVLARVLVLGEKPDRAIQEVKGYLDSRGAEADWRDHLLMAQTYEWAKQTENANASFAKAMELEDKDSAPATLAWAQILQQRGELAAAAAVYERLTRTRPDNDTLKQQVAKVYIAAGEYDKAEAMAKTLKETPERYQMLIQTAIGSNRLADAIQRSRAGVKAFPSHMNLRLQLARLLLGTQNRRPEGERDYDETERLAQQLLNDFPERVEIQLLMTDVHLAMNRFSQAINQLESILEFAPTHVAANERLYTIKLTEARELAQTSVEASQAKAAEAMGIVALLIKNRPDIAMLYRRGGEAADLAGQPDQSVTYYSKAFELTGEAQDLASYADALLRTDRGADARAVLEDPKHVSMVGGSLYLRALRGRALAASGEEEMATALFQNTLRNSEDAQSRLMLVQQAALAFEQQPEQAVKIVEEVLGKDLPVQLDSILASAMIKQRRYAEAASRLAKYEVDPVSDPAAQFQILMQLAVARQESDDLSASKRTYEKAIAIMENQSNQVPMRSQVHLLNNLAYLLADRMTGYQQDAVKYARKALALLPKNEAEENVALIEDTLGWALYKAGNYNEAVKVLTRSVDKYALSANQLHLGRTYLSLGKPDEALFALEAAMNKAKADKDPKMIEETTKWHAEAVKLGQR